MARQFQDDNFPSLSGARIVRIATHPNYQSMGYGSRALELLQHYYEMKIPNIEDVSSNLESSAIVDDEEKRQSNFVKIYWPAKKAQTPKRSFGFVRGEKDDHCQ